MRMALKLARKGRFATSPNPAVGCIIVRDHVIIGSGFHHRAGEDHAEVMALKSAGYRVEGATAYVTLEPCSHYGRTPPCARSLVKAGIARVVMAMTDPNPKVSGKGIAILKEGKVRVDSGLLADKAYRLNRAFFKSVSGQGPYVVVKVAASLDDKSALRSGESQWITSAKSRQKVQSLRARSDAIITGVKTVLQDNPRLNVRYGELSAKIRRNCYLWDKQPLKVILDSHGKLVGALKDFQLFSEGKNLLCVADRSVFERAALDHGVSLTEGQRLIALNEHVELRCCDPTPEGRVSLEDVLEELDNRQCRQILVEAGAALSSSFLDADLADEMWLFTGPLLLGEGSREALMTAAPENLDKARRFKLKKLQRIGDDILARYAREKN